jgi:two-component system sensor histidine kinase RegB
VIEFDLTMVQALENILNNAADAGSSKVEVNVAWDRREVRISVRDWGSGIPAQLLEKLGKPIIHADRSGLGIGLMLSQATVERYGGRIEWRNVKEGGTIATLILPLTQSPPAAEVAQ